MRGPLPPARRGRQFATRADELAAAHLETILSRRDYRAGLVCSAALWERTGARWPLADLKAALRAPHYTPNLGRKSCPWMLPRAPRRTEGRARAPDTGAGRRGTPGVVPSHGLNGGTDDDWVAAHQELGRRADRFIAFELGSMFVPHGRIYSLAAYEATHPTPISTLAVAS